MKDLKCDFCNHPIQRSETIFAGIFKFCSTDCLESEYYLLEESSDKRAKRASERLFYAHPIEVM